MARKRNRTDVIRTVLITISNNRGTEMSNESPTCSICNDIGDLSPDDGLSVRGYCGCESGKFVRGIDELVTAEKVRRSERTIPVAQPETK